MCNVEVTHKSRKKSEKPKLEDHQEELLANIMRLQFKAPVADTSISDSKALFQFRAPSAAAQSCQP